MNRACRGSFVLSSTRWGRCGRRRLLLRVLLRQLFGRQQVGIEDATSDGSGECRAASWGVLNNDGDCDLRCFDRRESNKQGVVTQMLDQFAGLLHALVGGGG